MKNKKIIASVCLAGLLALGTVQARGNDTASHPVVLELFTSQGCSSCPPADKLLGELADEKGVLALSYHITYWNNLGWRDPFSFDAATQRQRSYARAFQAHNVYTPELVVQGMRDVNGADRRAVRNLMDTAANMGPWIPVQVEEQGDNLKIHVASATPVDADLVLVGYLKHAETKVPRGENAGATLEHRNSVVSIRALGHWGGKATDLTEKRPQGDGYAVLIQQAGYGPLLGAGWQDEAR